MHIAFLNPQGNFDPKDSYWTQHPDFGGQLVYVKEIAAAMVKLGHKVDILTRQIIDPEWPEFAGKLDSYPGVHDLRIVRLPCGPEGFLPKEELWPYLGTDWVNNIQAFYAQEGGLPNIFTTHYGDGGLSGAVLEAKTGVPFTFTGHSLGAQKMDKLGVSLENLNEMLERYKFQYRIEAERLSMNRAANIFTSTQQERMEQYGHRAYQGAVNPADDSRFSVTPPGVNRKIFSPTPSEEDKPVKERINAAIQAQIPPERTILPVVLASSRLDKEKNHLGIVQAFAESAELRQYANFAIAVRGLADPLHEYTALSPSEKAVMDEIIETIEVSNLWHCAIGFPLNSQEELAAAYRVLSARQSVFILTALYEPFGLAPLEAMSSGLPAVVTKNGGPSESMIENGEKYGVLVDPADPADIASGILPLVSSPESWQQYQQAGIQRVIDKYTWERTAEGYLTVFKEILETGGSAPSNLPIPPDFTDPAQGEEVTKERLETYYFA
ncbi:MAG TPA: glycosyltransferase [Anaerolineales bacterium]|nr:glycosyltransferase [Anaerolineales bacterium]